eukprot:SAG31_NODE_279_length_18600_cov_21.254527_2_plen_296_part_00
MGSKSSKRDEQAAAAQSPFQYPDTSTMERASSCWLPTEFVDLPLLAVLPCNHDSKIFEFGLPPNTSLDLPVCACLLMKGTAPDGESVVRPYTPISANSMQGKFQLLVKEYAAGQLSRFVHSLSVGDTAGFKHIKFNVKTQLPYAPGPAGAEVHIAALCGGSGITPMYQALQRLASSPGDATKVTVLCSNKTAADVLLKTELDGLVSASAGRFTVKYFLTRTPEGEQNEADGWVHGRIDAESIKLHCPTPSSNVKVFVCGVPAMYEQLCGPRGETELPEGSVLAQLGYTNEMVVKF